MEIGIIGLGRMGGNMARRLLRAGHCVVAYDMSAEAVTGLEPEGAAGASSLEDLIGKLARPRAVWVMVPSGEITENTVQALAQLLSDGDTVIDGGNNYYKESVRHAEELNRYGIRFLDAGTSGGIWGLKEGYSLMVGGDEDSFRRLEPIFQALAPGPDQGYGYVGTAGAGHFVKMVHNGIEYGMMQAYAEGFELMSAKKEFGLDLHQISTIWQHGSVVRSWLLDLTASALEQDPDLEQVKAYVEDTGEGRWTVLESVETAVPTPVITAALQARFRSRQEQPFGVRLLAMMRNLFGGHAIRKS
jgi:6-phosphogluconate dehydrogenase